MSSTTASDSPWTSRLKASRVEAVECAVAGGKDEERAEIDRRVSHLQSLLPSPLSGHSSSALTDLVALHRALGLDPLDVHTTSIVTALDTLTQTSTELEIDTLGATHALDTLTRERSRLAVLEHDVNQFEDTLASSRPPSNNSAHDNSVHQSKIDDYVKEKAKLEARSDKNGWADISALQRRTKELEQIERENEKLKGEVSSFKGLPADYELAKLKVEEERRALEERIALRDAIMGAALT